ncbi:xin actin-binding repeat-containing protein 2 isoform X11 [Gadus macrocephalus]|uniref:xin actin-binding repeat-containing protein 2 isoform X11 n=1 Tax=Gadus macrocephalus TaxID=80720 RepID=UPI0028CB3EF4|nr:xin actin-binding repeat-containing protein 2 isoform X11 [Gadus macrocephalus]
MEVSEVCSLPGGVASVRHQFESQGTASSSSSHNVAQVHFQHRTVQEVSHLEGMVMGGARQVLPGNRQPDYHQEAVITDSANNMESSYNHNNETEEDFPRFTTKELRDHFERTIEEAGPSKQMKVINAFGLYMIINLT